MSLILVKYKEIKEHIEAHVKDIFYAADVLFNFIFFKKKYFLIA